jgi:C-terminal processing protease CtpA/Prc
MKSLRIMVPAAAAILLAGQAAAQTKEQQEAAESAAAAALEQAQEMEYREAEVARKLEEAERRMAEAARQIAELSTERLPHLRDIERRIEIFGSDKPRLGVTIGGATDGEPAEGVRIMGVTPGSAAADAGLRAGDVLTAINGESLSAAGGKEAAERLLDFMAGVEEGDTLDVEYLRDGKVGTVEVEPRAVETNVFAFAGPKGLHDSSGPRALRIAPEIMGRVGSPDFEFHWVGNSWGDMELVELSEGLGKYFGTDSGVLVVSAPANDVLKLEDGDVIRSIDGREPTSVRHALRILGSYQPGERLKLDIMRDKRKRTLDIEIPDDRSSMLWLDSPRMMPAKAPKPLQKSPRVSERT